MVIDMARSKLEHYFRHGQVIERNYVLILWNIECKQLEKGGQKLICPRPLCIRQHGFANESRYETAAQVYFGLPPDLPVLEF
jgi:hypothetical protein